MPTFDTALVWFRRDLRHFDHAALHHALAQSRQVYCAFIFDRAILDDLPRQDRRIDFIHASLTELRAALQEMGGDLIVLHAAAERAIPELAQTLGVDAVFANRDYEPAAIKRDQNVATALNKAGRALYTFKDQVIFECDEVLSQSGTPFSVFTPYKNAWLKKLHAGPEDAWLQAYDTEPQQGQLAAAPRALQHMPSLKELGFTPSNLHELKIPTGMDGGQMLLDDFGERMSQYHQTRDFPAVKGPSYLSVHLRFGTVSTRALVRRALLTMRAGHGAGNSGAATWLSELIWREFYFMILHHHPHVETHAFKPAYDAIKWESGKHADALFAAWCEGRTGYPLVDAAMAQINQTGYMHNRLRMVVASFLIKDLGIDWRWGERYFAEKLNDFDLSANNGGWQWAASSGCDAQPYFRIFNPVTQSEKFDADGKFIRRYLPQLAQLSNKHIHAPWKAAPTSLQTAGVVLGENYPKPIIQHEEARARTLQRYAVVKKVTES
ncbi:MAG: deoxyribodipyrimidine photo-lyase [Oxalicibacterium faecigallinarum]|uniref:cryptochrome/photolyase family protein n=1 Tax=Oxalicibacterium faecigallinarum TaxID=573741 RepID=UPI002808A7AF|nr:deoxyribodipyrimidine photo-lyase [Oxalicibacterium faecigallinarum]MDQ7968010.1 deoxyribodipyrimidine photo-lyase [Oxalicibacterium faecigallinarum]